MQPPTHAVADLFQALDDRAQAATRGDAAGLRVAEMTVGGHVAHLASVASRPARSASRDTPPRAVATALAQALFAAPHVSRTLAVENTMSEQHGFVPSPRLADALGLPLWQLEEIRDDIDRRVATSLRQIRALNWLWYRVDNPSMHPEPLYNLLFPGAGDPQPSRFVRRGGRMYALLPEEHPPPPEALYLRWLPGAAHWSAMPDDHFDSRFIDDGLLRSLGRSIGASPAEVQGLLDRMVCAIPEDYTDAFIRRDRWRNEGWAEVTGLGTAHPGPTWLALPLAPEALDVTAWMGLTDDGLELRAPRRVFDRHAMTRVTAMVRGLYSELLARMLSKRPMDPSRQAALFDLGPYIQRILQPLLDWTAQPATHAHVAEKLGVPPSHAAAALAKVRRVWLKAARTSWGGAPTADRPHTVQSLLAVHLAVLQASLHRVFRQPPDGRAPHHRVLLLFFAFYAVKAPLGRLWRAGDDGQLPPPEDVIGEWFWCTWRSAMDAIEADDGEDDIDLV